MYIDKNLQSSLVEKNDWWLALELKLLRGRLYYIFAYFNPAEDIKIYLTGLKDLIDELCSKNPDSHIIISGDFNARIGELNNYTDRQDNSIFDGWQITPDRSTLDTTTTSRGKRLVASMEELGLTVVNGRSKSDSPAQYTFMGHSAKKSIIDLVWANNKALTEIEDLKVLDCIIESDHYPLLLTLKEIVNPSFKNNASHKPSPPNTPRLKWNPEKATTFHMILSLESLVSRPRLRYVTKRHNTRIPVREQAGNGGQGFRNDLYSSENETTHTALVQYRMLQTQK